MNYHTATISDTYLRLKTDQSGLSNTEIESRQKKYGKNELKQKKRKSVFGLVLNQFKDVMILILILAAAISLVVGESTDAIVILIIVLLNALIGFVQEYRAEKAMEALKKMSALHATLRRENKMIQVLATELVPGDIVILEAGMLVPADIRLISTQLLKIEESSLTGESVAIEKSPNDLVLDNIPIGDRFNMAYKSTVVAYGKGEGVVVATGMKTEIGKIAELLEEDDLKPPLQQRMVAFAKKLSLVVLGICLVLVALGWLRGENIIQMLLTAISIAVAAIPEALPAVITISLALGAKKMVQQHVLIRKLPAAETLGSVNYICTDKTGTITQNKMTLMDCWVSPEAKLINNFNSKQLMLLAMELNHDVSISPNNELKGDPTEVALVEYARKDPEYNSNWRTDFNLAKNFPFDSTRKRMTTVYPMNGNWLVICKGGVESILSCSTVKNSGEINKTTVQFAEEGKRILGYAYKILDTLPTEDTAAAYETQLEFLGLAAMIDPPRPEAVAAIAACQGAGITPVMLTGDHPITAKAIATDTGIIKLKTDRLITGAELAALNWEDFESQIESIKVYARVSPEQKLNIVKALQHRNHFVAVTGDGVNDAPALRRADIGIAMGITGTDVSKEAADMILLDDNFSSIILAIKEGRRIFDNIRKFVKYILTGNSGEIWTILLAPILGLPIPLIPIQILWINLVSDGLPALAFAAELPEENILKRNPRGSKESVFSGGIGIHIIWVGLLIGVVCVLTQIWATQTENPKWATMVFTVLSISQIGHAMAIRSEIKSLFSIGVFGNKQMIFAVLITVVLQLAVIYVPFLQGIFHTSALSLFELAVCFGFSSIVFWSVEIEKWIKRIRKKRSVPNLGLR